jgi:hypothetical protein
MEQDVQGAVRSQLDRKPGTVMAFGDFRCIEIPLERDFFFYGTSQTPNQKIGFPGRQGINYRYCSGFFTANRAGNHAVRRTAGTGAEGFNPRKEQNTNFKRNIGF